MPPIRLQPVKPIKKIFTIILANCIRFCFPYPIFFKEIIPILLSFNKFILYLRTIINELQHQETSDLTLKSNDPRFPNPTNKKTDFSPAVKASYIINL